MKIFKLLPLPFCFLLFTLYFLPSISNADTTTCLVGYWNFDDGTATDISSNGRNGTIYGGASATAGKIGQALNFDGVDDYVDVGDIDLTTAFTMRSWVNFNQLTGSSHILIGKTYETYLLYADTSARRISFQRNSGNNNINYTHNFKVNEWHHIALTFNTINGYVLYVDNVAVKTDPS